MGRDDDLRPWHVRCVQCEARCLGVGHEVWGQAVSDRALVPRLDCIIGVQSRELQVGPHLVFLGRPLGQSLSSGGQAECCILSPEFPKWKACGPGV